MHIPTLAGVLNGRISHQKQSYFAKNVLFEAILEMKVTRMPIACFVFYLL